ncbi:unnamed protein product [Musa acuminata subsp. burmannicoides]
MGLCTTRASTTCSTSTTPTARCGATSCGPLGLGRHDQLEGARPCDLPVPAIRHLRVLVRLRNHPPRRQARDSVHRHRPSETTDPKHRLPQQLIRSLPARMDCRTTTP